MPQEITIEDLMRLLPGHYYMDPPDGGNVTILEQLQRMAQDAARYRYLRNGMIASQHPGKKAKFGLPTPDPITDIMEGSPKLGLDIAIDAKLKGETCLTAL
jgi:hypothetical protein